MIGIIASRSRFLCGRRKSLQSRIPTARVAPQRKYTFREAHRRAKGICRTKRKCGENHRASEFRKGSRLWMGAFYGHISPAVGKSRPRIVEKMPISHRGILVCLLIQRVRATSGPRAGKREAVYKPFPHFDPPKVGMWHHRRESYNFEIARRRWDISRNAIIPHPIGRGDAETKFGRRRCRLPQRAEMADGAQLAKKRGAPVCGGWGVNLMGNEKGDGAPSRRDDIRKGIPECRRGRLFFS